MSLQDEIDNMAGEISTDSYSMSIGELINLYKDEELDIHPEFQRVFRWKEDQKSKFIESLLLGIPIPPIFVSVDTNGVWDVIDGVQRLSTIFEFIGEYKDENGNLKPPNKLVGTKYLPSLEGKLWESQNEDESFTRSQRIDIKRKKFGIVIVEKTSDPKIKYELFQRINSLGTRLSDQELRNCAIIMINKDFYEKISELSKYEPFQNCICLSDNDLDKAYDMELVLRFLIFRHFNDSPLPSSINIADYLSEKALEIAESSSYDFENEKKIFENTFDLLNENLGEASFKRYDRAKDRFEGKFLVTVFETISIGLSNNIDTWLSMRKEGEPIGDLLKQKAQQIWSEEAFLSAIGRGARYNTRTKTLIPLGTKIFSLS